MGGWETSRTEPPALLAAFRVDQQRRNLRPGTIITRERQLRAFMAELDALNVATGEIETWLDRRRLNAGSRYAYLSNFAAFFDYLRRVGIRLDDPTRDIPRPRLPRRVPRPTAAHDFAYALRQADPRMKTWLCLSHYQGFRCCEIARLRREDVMDDREPPLIIIADGKGGHEDILPLNRETELALHEYGMSRHSWLFLSRRGQPYHPATVSGYIARFMRSVGVEATAHRGRHFLGTTIWAQTKDLLVTQKVMRHASPRTTQIYVEYDNPLMTDAMRGLSVHRHLSPREAY